MAEDIAEFQTAGNADGVDVFWHPPLPASATDCVAELPDGGRVEPAPFGGRDPRFGFKNLPVGTRITRHGDVIYRIGDTS